MADVTTIRAGDLTREQAVIKAGTLLSPWRQSVADGLTPQGLGALMRAADQGDIEAYLVLSEEIAEREPHYSSVLATRTLAVSGSDRGVAASGDSPDEKAIADDVEQLVQKPEFEGLIVDVLDGLAKGFACVETMWDRSLKRYEPTAYLFREQRHFVLDADTMTTPLLRTIDDPANGEPLAPYKWIIHRPKIRAGLPIRTGLARTVAICYAAKRFAIADWLSFLDIYGIPLKVGRYPSSMKDRAGELFKALQKLGTDATAVIPQEMLVEILETKASGAGATIFQQCVEYFDKQTSKVVLGQTMSSDDGASLSQSKVHERVRFDIRAADARAVIATINRDLIKPFCDLNYGPQKVYPSLYLRVEEPEDTEAFMRTVKLFVSLGGKVQMSEVRDRIGLAEPEEGAELMLPESAVAAAHAPKPPPAGDVPGEGGPDDKGNDAGADPDDEVEDDGTGAAAELNSVRARRRNGTDLAARLARFAELEGVSDVVDDVTAQKLAEWRPLVEGNVGRIMQELVKADSFEQARQLLSELTSDEGEIVDIGALVVSLARSTFLARGVGDGTDDVEL